MIHLFCGFDHRESVGFHAFVSSVLSRTKETVSFVPLTNLGLQMGSNAFTLSRFLVPHFMHRKGHAIFADASDMVCMADIAELDKLFDPSFAVQVVKHPNYTSKEKMKYVGTEMECAQRSYPKKNWASLMIFNCEHPIWNHTRPENISNHRLIDLLQFSYMEENMIGDIPKEWNVLVDEGQDPDGAKVLHWTNGIPGFNHYRTAPKSEVWMAEVSSVIKGMQ